MYVYEQEQHYINEFILQGRSMHIMMFLERTRRGHIGTTFLFNFVRFCCIAR